MAPTTVGRDVLTRLLYGLRYGMIYALMVWIISFIVGTLIGGLMGYLGGKIDFLGQRFVEILTSIPQFFLLLMIISIFSPNLFWLILISCLFGWIPISYYARAEFLKNRKREYVEAAKSIGTSQWRIISRHVLPNSLTPLITFSPFVITTGITSLASLDYLGFGLEIPHPQLGRVAQSGAKELHYRLVARRLSLCLPLPRPDPAQLDWKWDPRCHRPPSNLKVFPNFDTNESVNSTVLIAYKKPVIKEVVLSEKIPNSSDYGFSSIGIDPDIDEIFIIVRIIVRYFQAYFVRFI